MPRKKSPYTLLKKRLSWRTGTLIAFVTLVIGLGYVIVSASAATYAFDDEFSGTANTAPSSTRWARQTGNGTNGWGNQELEYYTSSNTNSYLDGAGHLVIQAKKYTGTTYQCWNGPCKYTSAKLITKNKFSKAYGHFEARIQMPNLQNGLWPAFWALGNNIDTVGWPKSGEIDIMENFGWTAIQGSLHGPVPANDFSAGYGTLNHNPTGWHTYAIDWTSSQVTYTIDGVVYGTATKAQMGADWVFDHPFYLLLNMAVGGSGTGNMTPSTMPAKMLVDYIRVK